MIFYAYFMTEISFSWMGIRWQLNKLQLRARLSMKLSCRFMHRQSLFR
ncbi:hypothetical protein CKO_04781 [Citrobacter koseri ATCC BAA-895]|uniref:Uncharacterized protein n=1 Tax=Citrobacter koseri (strain ATCC BAA-895 / CDC 4225-83 / SGSC4696) TaxID=290338 RepID=A8AQR3_CITK8|nr:hypothetical protein CKO_04781 [Citrobacter koseri ATCC BAA-895]